MTVKLVDLGLDLEIYARTEVYVWLSKDCIDMKHRPSQS